MTVRDIPSIPERNVDPELRRVLVRIREVVQDLIGSRGDGSYRAALAEAIGGGATVVVQPGSGTGGGGGTDPDLTPPPAPSDFTADAGFSNVIAEWTGITYTQGRGHKQTNIYGVQRDPASTAPLPVFGDANIVTVAPDALTLATFASELNTRWHLWATFVTNDGVEGPPAGGTNGVVAQTAVDVSQLLGALSGAIRASELSAALNNRINLIDGPDTLAGSVAARILAEATARGAAITAEATARANGDSALASSITTLTTSVGNNAAAITAEQNARIAGDNAQASNLNALAATVTGNRTEALAAVASEQTARVNADNALASSISSLTTTVANNQATLTASINSEATTRANADTALSNQITTLSSTVGSNSAAIAAEASTRASVDGYLGAQYTVRAQITQEGRTVVGGFGLSATNAGAAGATIDFGVVANRFWVAAPTGNPGVADIQPFVIVATPTTINGVAVPVGAYMDAAFILNGSIGSAKLGNAIIDDAKISTLSAAKFTGGEMRVGSFLQSTDWAGGSGGFRIGADGNATFRNGVFNGTINAVSGTIGGVTINAGDIRSNYVPGSSGFRLSGSTGYLEAISGVIGNLVMDATGVRSANYTPGSAGMKINAADGSAEFSNIKARGDIQATSLNGQIVNFANMVEGAALMVRGTREVDSADPTTAGWVALAQTPPVPLVGGKRVLVMGGLQAVFASSYNVTTSRGSRAILNLRLNATFTRPDTSQAIRTGVMVLEGGYGPTPAQVSQFTTEGRLISLPPFIDEDPLAYGPGQMVYTLEALVTVSNSGTAGALPAAPTITTRETGLVAVELRA